MGAYQPKVGQLERGLRPLAFLLEQFFALDAPRIRERIRVRMIGVEKTDAYRIRQMLAEIGRETPTMTSAAYFAVRV